MGRWGEWFWWAGEVSGFSDQFMRAHQLTLRVLLCEICFSFHPDTSGDANIKAASQVVRDEHRWYGNHLLRQLRWSSCPNEVNTSVDTDDVIYQVSMVMLWSKYIRWWWWSYHANTWVILMALIRWTQDVTLIVRYLNAIGLCVVHSLFILCHMTESTIVRWTH